MNREATEKLRLDRRLTHRRGWISKAEFEQALAELPDVSDKIAPAEDPDESDAARADGDTAAPTESPRAE
jgi:hypothetical protein